MWGQEWYSDPWVVGRDKKSVVKIQGGGERSRPWAEHFLYKFAKSEIRNKDGVISQKAIFTSTTHVANERTTLYVAYYLNSYPNPLTRLYVLFILALIVIVDQWRIFLEECVSLYIYCVIGYSILKLVSCIQRKMATNHLFFR